jgi:SAM-dependent methyltransferase
MAPHNIGALNRVSWSRPAAAAEFDIQGFIDAGERTAFISVASRVRGLPAIDIGVGAGRTVALVRLLTDDYVALDYSPAMVAACGRNHPTVDVRPGDVRDLADFEDTRFGLVLFSFNGIDNVSHEDRPRALKQLFRVARPGGWLVFSTHNMDGPSYREVPWRGYPTRGPLWYRAARWLVRLPLNMPRHARRWINWQRNRRLNREGDGWSEHASALREFGLMQHYITLDALFAEMAQAGFDSIEVYGSETGCRLEPGGDTRHVHAFHVVAQRPGFSAASRPGEQPSETRLQLVSASL